MPYFNDTGYVFYKTEGVSCSSLYNNKKFRVLIKNATPKGGI